MSVFFKEHLAVALLQQRVRELLLVFCSSVCVHSHENLPQKKAETLPWPTWHCFLRQFNIKGMQSREDRLSLGVGVGMRHLFP